MQISTAKSWISRDHIAYANFEVMFCNESLKYVLLNKLLLSDTEVHANDILNEFNFL